MEGEKRDIFGDTRFSEKSEKAKKDEVVSYTKGIASLGSGLKQILLGLGHILFRRFFFNLFGILLILSIGFFGAYFLKWVPTTVYINQTVMNQTNITMTEYINQTKYVCCDNVTIADNMADCEPCPSRNIIYYRCKNGALVEDEKDCTVLVPEIKSDYKKESNGITLSIDALKLEFNSDNKTGYIKQINYTVINQGSNEISPKIEIKTYAEWNYEVRTAPPQKTLKPEDIKLSLDVDEWVIKSSPVTISFDGGEKTIRLELLDALNDESLVVVTMPIDFSSYK